jgi:hypothetical protein
VTVLASAPLAYTLFLVIMYAGTIEDRAARAFVVLLVEGVLRVAQAVEAAQLLARGVLVEERVLREVQLVVRDGLGLGGRERAAFLCRRPLAQLVPGVRIVPLTGKGSNIKCNKIYSSVEYNNKINRKYLPRLLGVERGRGDPP